MKKMVLLFSLCLASLATLAQSEKPETGERIELISAKSMEGMIDDSIVRFSGNCTFKQGASVALSCDSAKLNNIRNHIKLFKNARLVYHDSLSITADTMKYQGDNKFLRARGHVLLKDSGMEIKTSELIINFNEGKAYFTGYAIVNGKEYELKDKLGVYNTKSKSVSFLSQVRSKKEKK